MSSIKDLPSLRAGATLPEIVDYLVKLQRQTADNFTNLEADIEAKLELKADKGLAGTKVYYVADSSGGAVTRKLTHIDGVVTSET